MEHKRRDQFKETTVRVREDPLEATRTAPKRPCLVVIAGLDAGNSINVSGRPVRVGRDDECSLSLRDDGVSRHHVEVVLRDDNRLEVQDLGSSNGTFIDGRQIARTEIAPGQKFTIGLNSVIRFEIQDGYDQAYHRQMYDARVRDWLTGAHNRRYFDEQLPVALSHASRQRRSLSVLLLDVDHFKRVNDEHGHAVGDAVLVALGRTMREVLRAEDLLARIGGEEFAVLAHDTDFDGACRLAERLRVHVGRLQVIHSDESDPIVVTVSIGGVAVRPSATADMHDVLAASDGNLYAAKEAGRNRERVSLLEDASEAAASRRHVMSTYRFGHRAIEQAATSVGLGVDDLLKRR